MKNSPEACNCGAELLLRGAVCFKCLSEQRKYVEPDERANCFLIRRYHCSSVRTTIARQCSASGRSQRRPFLYSWWRTLCPNYVISYVYVASFSRSFASFAVENLQSSSTTRRHLYYFVSLFHTSVVKVYLEISYAIKYSKQFLQTIT